VTHNFPTKSPKDQQLKGELRGDLGTYEKIGLFQRDISQNTAYRYRGALLRFQAFLGNNPPTPAASLEYLSGLRKNELDPATLRVYSVALRGFHEWRGEELKFKVKVPKKAPKLIPEEPILKMLEQAAAKPHDELILRLMTDAGMRRDETVNLTEGAAEDGWLRFVGKGKKERQVPMTRRLAELVKMFSTGKSPDTNLVGVGEKGIYGLVKRYAATAGHPELAPHDLRRYFGMRVQEISGDIRVTQELLGHSNVNTTQIYTAVKPKRLEDAIARLNGPGLGEQAKRPEQNSVNIDRLLADLASFSVKLVDRTTNAANFLSLLWQKFGSGITTVQVIQTLTTEFGFSASDPQALWNGVETLLAQLNLRQIIFQEQRRGGTTVRGKVDIGHWVLTDFGKTVVLEIEKRKTA